MLESQLATEHCFCPLPNIVLLALRGPADRVCASLGNLPLAIEVWTQLLSTAIYLAYVSLLEAADLTHESGVRSTSEESAEQV